MYASANFCCDVSLICAYTMLLTTMFVDCTLGARFLSNCSRGTGLVVPPPPWYGSSAYTFPSDHKNITLLCLFALKKYTSNKFPCDWRALFLKYLVISSICVGSVNDVGLIISAVWLLIRSLIKEEASHLSTSSLLSLSNISRILLILIHAVLEHKVVPVSLFFCALLELTLSTSNPPVIPSMVAII